MASVDDRLLPISYVRASVAVWSGMGKKGSAEIVVLFIYRVILGPNKKNAKEPKLLIICTGRIKAHEMKFLNVRLHLQTGSVIIA